MRSRISSKFLFASWVWYFDCVYCGFYVASMSGIQVRIRGRQNLKLQKSRSVYIYLVYILYIYYIHTGISVIYTTVYRLVYILPGIYTRCIYYIPGIGSSPWVSICLPKNCFFFGGNIRLKLGLYTGRYLFGFWFHLFIFLFLPVHFPRPFSSSLSLSLYLSLLVLSHI